MNPIFILFYSLCFFNPPPPPGFSGHCVDLLRQQFRVHITTTTVMSSDRDEVLKALSSSKFFFHFFFFHVEHHLPLQLSLFYCALNTFIPAIYVQRSSVNSQ